MPWIPRTVSSAHLPVTGNSRAAYAFSFGTFAITGTVDPLTGAFTMTGNIPGSGVFTIGGTLPEANGNGGGYTLTAGGETYTGSFGSVPIPSPSPVASSTPTPSPSPLPNGATTFQIVSKSTDCNVIESKLNNFAVKSARFSGSGSTYSFTGQLSSGDANFTLNWLRLNDGDGFTPETLAIPANPNAGAFGDDFQIALSSAISMPIGTSSAGFWRPMGGTFIIESINGKSVTVRGENVVFKPTPVAVNSGTGEFTANFRLTFDSVTGL